MGEAKRRNSRIELKYVGTEEISVSDFMRMGSMCAWDGCDRTFDKDMPPGWNWVISFWAPGVIHHLAEIGPRHWLHDCALCPEHSQMLGANFKRFRAEGA